MSYRKPHPQFLLTFRDFDVPEEMKEAFWNYFAYGWDPGGFGMSILKNDFINAVCRAHPVLSVENLRHIAKWLINYAPTGSFASAENVKSWITKTDEERRDIMIEYQLRPSVVDILKGAPA